MTEQTTGFRFLWTFLASLAAIVFVFLSVVTIVDPNGVFEGIWFPIIRVSARADKVRLFPEFRAKGPVTGLVLGSSRSMILPSEELDPPTGKRFFNGAVYNGFPEDDLAMYRSLVRDGATPRLVIVGVDDDHLDDNRPYDQEMEWNYRFRAQVDDSIRGPVGLALHRLRYYKTSLSFIMVSNLATSVSVKLHHEAPASYWKPDGERVVLRATPEDDGGGYVKLLDDMTQLSTRRRDLLETLIREAQAGGAKVILFVTPYRPVRLAQIRANSIAWQHHLMAVDYLMSLRARYGIRVLDYTDEASFGGDPNDWFDGVHITRANGVRLARQIIHDGL